MINFILLQFGMIDANYIRKSGNSDNIFCKILMDYGEFIKWLKKEPLALIDALDTIGDVFLTAFTSLKGGQIMNGGAFRTAEIFTSGQI